MSYLQPEVQAIVQDFVTGPPRGLFISADQASCGISAMAFLHSSQYLYCGLLADPPHRFWNSEKLALLASHAWEAVLRTTIPYSVHDGPWLSAGFHTQVQEAKADFLAPTNRESCLLFQEMLPLIAQDKGRPQDCHKEDFQVAMWRELQEASQLRSKGPKPALCRWYSWVDSHDHWRECCHQRLMLLYMWGMGCGVVTKGTGAASFTLSVLPQAIDAAQKETMKDQAAKAARIRAKGKSMLHVPLIILMRPLVLRKAGVVYWSLQPMMAFHGQQVVKRHTVQG